MRIFLHQKLSKNRVPGRISRALILFILFIPGNNICHGQPALKKEVQILSRFKINTGKWDYNGSEAWLNGRRIEPPVLKNAGYVPADPETPYVDENFWLRVPLPVHLDKGWNTLLLKLPVGAFSTEYTRLVKWMFTALIVSSDGKTRPDGLIYSPEAIINR